MDVQKQDDLIKEAFEIEAEEIGFCLDQLWGDYENPYENSDTALAFNLFKKGWLAKAQAVPEWAVIVPKLSANYLFNTVPELGFEHQDQKDTVLYHLNYMASEFRDSAKQFVEDDHAKQKAMIEAQEQSYDNSN